MIWCWRIRYSGHSSARRGSSTSARVGHARTERRARLSFRPAGGRCAELGQWTALILLVLCVEHPVFHERYRRGSSTRSIWSLREGVQRVDHRGRARVAVIDLRASPRCFLTCSFGCFGHRARISTSSRPAVSTRCDARRARAARRGALCARTAPSGLARAAARASSSPAREREHLGEVAERVGAGGEQVGRLASSDRLARQRPAPSSSPAPRQDLGARGPPEHLRGTSSGEAAASRFSRLERAPPRRVAFGERRVREKVPRSSIGRRAPHLVQRLVALGAGSSAAASGVPASCSTR